VLEGQVYANPADAPQVNHHICVSPDYFRTLGITLKQGRGFTRTDDPKVDRVVIDETIARRFFPDGGALGKRMKIPYPDGERLAEIIGITASVKSEGPTAASLPDVYVPFPQMPWNNFFVHVRTPLGLAAAADTIKRIVHEIDGDVPVSDVASMEQVTAMPSHARRFPLGLLGVFAALALVLATVGIYAVTTYGVAQRTREIGVRLALGASPRAVVALVLAQGFRPIAVGLLAGLAASTVTAFAMRKFLFGVDPLDLPTFALIPVLLAVMALFACWLPARRATKVDPIVALRTE
jgi:putative ABC transport system permease protein